MTMVSVGAKKGYTDQIIEFLGDWGTEFLDGISAEVVAHPTTTKVYRHLQEDFFSVH